MGMYRLERERILIASHIVSLIYLGIKQAIVAGEHDLEGRMLYPIPTPVHLWVFPPTPASSRPLVFQSSSPPSNLHGFYAMKDY
jgi:hypothetical protein